MTSQKDPVAAVIDDARALIDALLATDWAEVHVTGTDFAIFIARDGGCANPMRALPDFAAQPAAVPAGPFTTLSAAQVATVDWIAAVGDRLEPGQAVARLSVLDEPQDLTAQRGGTVVQVHAAPGDLVEFGMPLAEVAEDE